MKKKTKLSATMTMSQFDNGYWYTAELREFAKSIGIAYAGKLRKDQLEETIKGFIRRGSIKPSGTQIVAKTGTKDVDLGLDIGLPVKNYTDSKETKDFLDKEALKISPGQKRKSGARYRLNRWREKNIAMGIDITYGDLVREYVRLNRDETRFDRIPQGRYINFLSDFLKSEKNSTRKQAIKAWKELKELDIPKDYRSWKKLPAAAK